LASEGKVAIGDAFFAEDFEFPAFLLLFFFPVAVPIQGLFTRCGSTNKQRN
jgi:hypothetical protein